MQVKWKPDENKSRNEAAEVGACLGTAITPHSHLPTQEGRFTASASSDSDKWL